MSGPGAGGSYGSTTWSGGSTAADNNRPKDGPTLPVTKNNGSSSFSQKSTTYNFTTKKQANFSLEQAWLDMFGVAPSAKVKKEFYSLLNKLEKKTAGKGKTSSSGSKGTQTSTSYTFSTDDVLSEFVQKYVPSMFKQGNLGETAAKAFDDAVTYANNMGVAVSQNTILSDVTNSVLKKKTTSDIKKYYRDRALKMYPNLAKRLEEDDKLTIRDLATSYINKFSVMFDKDESQISLTDPDIQDALSKDKSMSDFTTSLKKRSDYGVTNFAKQEASDLAQSFKRVWGF